MRKLLFNGDVLTILSLKKQGLKYSKGGKGLSPRANSAPYEMILHLLKTKQLLELRMCLLRYFLSLGHEISPVELSIYLIIRLWEASFQFLRTGQEVKVQSRRWI